MIQPATVPEELARNRRLKDLAFFVYKIKRCSFVDTIVQQPPTGSNNITANGSSHAISANSNGYEIDKKYDTPVRDIESDNKESRADILTASPGLMISAQQKVKERERNIERFCSKMEDLRERISEDKEIRDQSGKKGRLEDFPSGDILIEKKEQVAGLLSIGPGVLVAARQKGKDRERNIERDRSSKIRGERRPGSKLVETRTSSSGKSSSRRERRSAASAVTNGDTNRTKGNVRNQTEIQRHHKVKAAQADFPPLPGAREPSPQTAALNYASSALFTPTAPVLLDPFADDDSEGSENSSDSDNINDSDDSRDEEDDNYNDDLNEEEDKDDAGLDDFSKPDLDSMIEGDPLPSYDGDNWNIATSMNAPNLHTTIIPPAFGGLFSRPANASSTGSLFSEYSAQMDLGPSMSTAHQGPYEEDDDDDFADDVVVFRPAFSRFSASPAPSIKQSMTSGVNSISPMPTLLSYPLNGTLGQPYDSKEMEFTGMNQNKPQHSMESIRSMFSDTYNSNQTQPQPLRKIDHWQNNGIYDPSIESMKAFPCQPVGSSDIFRNVNSGCPMEVPMGSAFGRSTGFEYSCKEQDMNFTSDVNTADEWWKGTDNSMETQPCTAILSSPPPMEYVGMRSTRGPPALQHVPHGSLNTTNSMISRNPIPQHPPGLVQPPPGFGSMTDRKSNSENNLQSMQYQQQQQQPYRDSSNDLWTANPFYRSNG